MWSQVGFYSKFQTKGLAESDFPQYFWCHWFVPPILGFTSFLSPCSYLMIHLQVPSSPFPNLIFKSFEGHFQYDFHLFSFLGPFQVTFILFACHVPFHIFPSQVHFAFSSHSKFSNPFSSPLSNLSPFPSPIDLFEFCRCTLALSRQPWLISPFHKTIASICVHSPAQEWRNRTFVGHEPLICSKMCLTKTELVQW